MKFDTSKRPERAGKVIGFLFSYTLFTTILFFALLFIGKLPASWTYVHVMGMTFLILLVGTWVRRSL